MKHIFISEINLEFHGKIESAIIYKSNKNYTIFRFFYVYLIHVSTSIKSRATSLIQGGNIQVSHKMMHNQYIFYRALCDKVTLSWSSSYFCPRAQNQYFSFFVPTTQRRVAQKHVTKTDIYLGSYCMHIFTFDPFTKICTSSRNTLMLLSLFSSMYI